MVADDIIRQIDMERTVIEIHNLSYFYHWGRVECWNTPCTERGVFNDQIMRQIKAETKGINK